MCGCERVAWDDALLFYATVPNPSLDRLRIVLVRTSLPANIGAAARAMFTMGLRRLVLVAPRQFPHPDATALAAGATDVLDNARTVATLDEALAGATLSIGLSARPRKFAGRVLPLREAAAEAVGHAHGGDVALVFGTEMSGLSNDELARCSIAATIAANPDYRSLNLAAAVQVAAWELRMAAQGRRRLAGAALCAGDARRHRSAACAREAHARRTGLLRSASTAPAAAEAAPPFRARVARARGGQHPARHPRTHRRGLRARARGPLMALLVAAITVR